MKNAAKEGIAELKEQEAVLAQTAAAITSTGGAAGVSVEHVDELSQSLLKLSGTDDEIITKGQDLLLSFTDVQNKVGEGNDIFDRATKAGLDLAARGFGSVEGNARLLGIALEDPEKGLTRLRRAGVVLTEQQIDSIKGFAATGDLLDEQKVLLDALEGKVGGAAKAYGETLPGQVAIANESMKNAKAAVVAGAAPAMELMASVTTGAADAISGLPKPLQEVVGGIGLLVFAAAGIARPLQAGIQIFQLLTKSREAATVAGDAEAVSTAAAAAASGTAATATEAQAIATGQLALFEGGAAVAGDALAASNEAVAATAATAEVAEGGMLAVLGPIGIAVGVLAAGFAIWNSGSSHAEEVAGKLKDTMKGLRPELDNVATGGATLNKTLTDFVTKMVQANQLVVGGSTFLGTHDLTITDALNKAGVSAQQFADIVATGGPKFNEFIGGITDPETQQGLVAVAAGMQQSARSALDAGPALGEFTQSQKDAAIAANTSADGNVNLVKALADARTAVTSYTGTNAAATESVDELRTHTDDLTDAEKELVKQADAAAKAHEDFAGFIDDLSSAMDRSYKSTFAGAEASDSFAESVNALEDSLKKNGTTLDVVADKHGRFSEKALENQKAVRGTGDAIAALIEQRFKETHSVDEAVSAGQLYVDNLTEQLSAAGYNADEIQHMIEVMHLTPDQIRTEFSSNALEQQVVVAKYIKELDDIKPEYKSQIEAELNRGLLDQASADLDAAAHGRVVDFTLNVHGGGQITMTNRATGEVTTEADISARNITTRARGGPVGPGEVFRGAEDGYELLVHDGLYNAGSGGYVLPNDLTMALARFGAAPTSSSTAGAIQIIVQVDAGSIPVERAHDVGQQVGEGVSHALAARGLLTDLVGARG